MEKTRNATVEEKVSDLKYLSDTMDGNKQLIKEVIEVFLKQAPEELSKLNSAVEKSDYASVRSLSHTMKSSASIMGISSVANILNELEELGKNSSSIERIRLLNVDLNSIIKQAIQEIEKEKSNFTVFGKR